MNIFKNSLIIGIILGSIVSGARANAATVHISCAFNESYNNSVDLDVTGDEISATFTYNSFPSTELEIGHLSSDGTFILNFAGACGSGFYINVDPGLLNGSVRNGAVTVSLLGTEQCEGYTRTYNCSSR